MQTIIGNRLINLKKKKRYFLIFYRSWYSRRLSLRKNISSDESKLNFFGSNVHIKSNCSSLKKLAFFISINVKNCRHFILIQKKHKKMKLVLPGGSIKKSETNLMAIKRLLVTTIDRLSMIKNKPSTETRKWYFPEKTSRLKYFCSNHGLAKKVFSIHALILSKTSKLQRPYKKKFIAYNSYDLYQNIARYGLIIGSQEFVSLNSFSN